MDIQIDSDYMLNLSEDKRRKFSGKLLDLDKYARKKVDEGKLSKVMGNRILHLCTLIPPKNKNKFSIPFYKENSKFSEEDKKKIRIAMNKLKEIYKEEQITSSE